LLKDPGTFSIFNSQCEDKNSPYTWTAREDYQLLDAIEYVYFNHLSFVKVIQKNNNIKLFLLESIHMETGKMLQSILKPEILNAS